MNEQPCYRCKGSHRPKVCPFINKECYFCKAKGHVEKVCRKKARANKNNAYTSNVVVETEESEEDLFSIYHLSHKPTPPIKLNIVINNCTVPIEVDTGASISLLNWTTFEKVKQNSKYHVSTDK